MFVVSGISCLFVGAAGDVIVSMDSTSNKKAEQLLRFFITCTTCFCHACCM